MMLLYSLELALTVDLVATLLLLLLLLMLLFLLISFFFRCFTDPGDGCCLLPLLQILFLFCRISDNPMEEDFLGLLLGGDNDDDDETAILIGSLVCSFSNQTSQ